MTEQVYILLGSNLGDRGHNLSAACKKIAEISGINIISSSSIYNSPAQGMADNSPDFLNRVIEISCRFSPMQLLDKLEEIEKQFGRVSKGDYQSRLLDLDILLYGDEIINSERLTIPHSELLERPFAMIPLVEIAPDIVHPKTRKLLSRHINEIDFEQVTLHEEHVETNR